MSGTRRRGVSLAVALLGVALAAPLARGQAARPAQPPSAASPGAAPLAAGAPRSAGDPRSSALGDLRQEIEAGHARLAGYEARTQGLLGALQSIDDASAQLGADVKQSEAALRDARRSLEAARTAAIDADAQLESTRVRLARRVVALARDGEAGVLRALFAPGSLAQRYARVALLRRLAGQDARLIDRHRADLRAVDAAQVSLARARATRDGLRRDLAARRSALAEEKAARQLLLRRVRSDAVREREGVAELEAAAASLERKLAELGEEAPLPLAATMATPASFARLRGHLQPPVDAPVRRAFGRTVEADFRTETFRKGIDFGARQGEAVRAVAHGAVRFAGWFRGYGKMVILDHGDRYFSVSGHLDEIRVAVGDDVAAGDVIGSAGDTGSLTGALLYFELRRGADALDPGEWLEPGRLVASPPAGG